MSGILASEHQAVSYPMQRWVFGDSAGRYDIDLGDSNVQCASTSELRIPGNLELNYGADRGTPELTKLIAERYRGQADHVVVTHGAQEALYLLYCTLLRPGDRVVAFRPGWQQAWSVPQRLGCQVQLVELRDDFSIDLAALSALEDTGLRLITLNSPSNPTGRRMREHELSAILALAQRSGAYIIADEEYLLDLSESIAIGQQRVISVSSLSKMAGVPGLRVGWMYGAPDIVAECADYKHLTSISNSVLCEYLAATVLADWPAWAQRYARLTQAGLRHIQQFAADHEKAIRLVPPDGTPFAWVKLTTGESSLAFARRVLSAGVLVMPGETLGAPGGLRISFAREPTVLAEGFSRIHQVLCEHS